MSCCAMLRVKRRKQCGYCGDAVDQRGTRNSLADRNHAMDHPFGRCRSDLACFCAVFFFVKKDRKTALMLILAVAGTWAINDLIIKNLVNRPRPFLVSEQLPALIAMPSSSSFPSGHTATSFAALVILMSAGKPYSWLGLILTVLIAFSRIYLHVHFPSDVIAGMLVGFIIGLLTLKAFRSVAQRPRALP